MCREAILDAIHKFPLDEVKERASGRRDSILGIIVDLINTERYWISILRGVAMNSLDPNAVDCLDQVRSAWKENQEMAREVVDSLTPETMHYVLSIRKEGQTISFTTAKVFLHLATYEAHKHGLLESLIMNTGRTPPNLDML
jgi:uncharacterized damage-inducible protein DinB